MTRSFDLDAAKGMLLGLAVGDAVGTTLEFAARDSRPPVEGMEGGGPFGLEPGVWTDDTSMALCLGESLLERRGWDPENCARRFVRWRDEGHMSVTGTCFDIGNTVAEALRRFEETGEPYAGSSDPDRAGNGGIMRLAPAIIAFHARPDRAAEVAVLQSRITHGARECDVWADGLGRYLLSGGLDVVQPMALPAATPREQVRSTGYVVDTAQAAFWAFESTGSFREAVLLAANLGGDADTVAAVTGQIAGRAYGLAGIPPEWLAALAWRPMIEGMAEALFEQGAR